ncbi:hypothetical protein ANN_15451 [Periplaneta americana]|uniref:Uncharacterized protein n=1 Tax=Periplaneta americana TaxID=6978 RepID=A0ABQ8SGF7_PERAM|nr:hypothetical protein ANN_15451 [Periplaneta americana]
MSPGFSTESYSAFAHIGLRENPGKNLNQVVRSGLRGGQSREANVLTNLVIHYTYYVTSVCEYLNEMFTQRWIGRGSPILPVPLDWPPRSPDLKTCDSALWFYQERHS